MGVNHDAKAGIQGKGCLFHIDYSETKGTDEELAELLATCSQYHNIGFSLGCKLLCEREPDGPDKTKQHQLKPEDVEMLAKDIRRWLWFEDETKQYPLDHYKAIVKLFVGAKYRREKEK